jgi:hypothetical protein
MAHGNRSVAIAVLERRPHGPDPEMFMVTTSYRVIAAFVDVVADLVEAARDQQDRLNA